METFAVIGLIIIGILALVMLYFEGLLKTKARLFVSAALILAALTLRGVCMSYETLDYQNFLTRWVAYFAENGGWNALGGSVGNYNVPYLYFLALFSYSSVSDLYLIKLLSIFFDFVLAWGVMRLTYVFYKTPRPLLAAFFVTLFLPTVVLNGALWGQCDSIYAAFAVFSIYFALDGRPTLSVISVALSFAFKLQAVFIMPIFVLFLYTRRVRWYHLAAFPATYVLVVLPAVAQGREFWDTLLLYFSQASSVGDSLNYNSSSVFAFFGNVENTELASALGIAAAVAFTAGLLALMFYRRANITDAAALACALLLCIGIPFLLPHMHDRYFFIADALSVAFAFIVPKLFAVPMCVSFASLLGYHAYLKMRYLLPMRYGAAALLAALALTAAFALAETSAYAVEQKSVQNN